ncbi:MAG: sugar ABC transporter permease [Spirochaetia bacterium]|nr:sugar ABC transporter permease [Spirochaetia bacterium]
MISNKSMKRSAIFFVSPLIILITIFMVYPTVSTLYLAFTEWNGFSDPTWNGLDNLKKLFTDASFYASLKNMLILTLYIPVWVLFPLIFAELVRKPRKGDNLFRSTILIPYVISPVVLGMFFKQILGVEGLVTEMIQEYLPFLGTVGFLTDQQMVIHTIAIITLWKFFGFGVILYYGAMSKISDSLYESAKLDGCNWTQTLLNVTVPGIRYTLQFFMVLGFITFYARMFPLTFTLTRGGPGFASFVPEFGIYYQAFNNSNMGYASTWALFVYVITLGIIMIQNRTMMKEA